MLRYLAWAPKQREYAPNVRLVHNFCPGSRDNPGRDRKVGLDGYRIWIIDEPQGTRGDEHRCYCGWLNGREHYGTVGYIDEDGRVVYRGQVVEDYERPQ